MTIWPTIKKNIDKAFKKMLAKSGVKNFQIVGLSVPNYKCLPMALILAKKIKEASKSIVVLGGWPLLGGVDKDFFRKYPFVDYVSILKSYYPFLELVSSLKNRKSRAKIPGIISRDFFDCPKEVHDQADKLPVPDFSTLPLDYYKLIPKSSGPFSSHNTGKKLPLQYFFIQGCPYNCSFCNNSAKEDKTVTFKPVNKIVEDLTLLSKKYSTNCFFFLNHAINLNDSFLNDFCDAVIKRKLNILWSDSAKPKKLKLLLKMRKAGCICLSWGLESGNEAILRSMNKGHTADEAAKTLRYSHEAGIWNRVNIIVGYPGETDSQFRDTLKFIQNNIEFIDDLLVHEYFLCHSAISANPEKYGIRIKERNLAGFQTWGFDEINGLKWEEKMIQMRERHQAVRFLFLKLKKNILSSSRDYNYNIFYLYEKFKTKEAIKKHLGL